MIKKLNKTLPKSRKPLNWPLRVQEFLCTRREDLPGRTHMVGAAALYPMVAVWPGGKIGVGRCAAISTQKWPTFVTCRQIYPENFGQGFHSGRRRQRPWTRDLRGLTGPLQIFHTLEMDPAPRIFRPDIRASRYRVRSLHFLCRADMCHIRCFKFN